LNHHQNQPIYHLNQSTSTCQFYSIENNTNNTNAQNNTKILPSQSAYETNMMYAKPSLTNNNNSNNHSSPSSNCSSPIANITATVPNSSSSSSSSSSASAVVV